MIKISVSLVDGGARDWNESDSVYWRYLEMQRDGFERNELFHKLSGDDWGPPPVGIRMTGTLTDGKMIDEYLPYKIEKKRRRR